MGEASWESSWHFTWALEGGLGVGRGRRDRSMLQHEEQHWNPSGWQLTSWGSNRHTPVTSNTKPWTWFSQIFCRWLLPAFVCSGRQKTTPCNPPFSENPHCTGFFLLLLENGRCFWQSSASSKPHSMEAFLGLAPPLEYITLSSGQRAARCLLSRSHVGSQ